MRPNVKAVKSPARKASITFHPSVLTNFSTMWETVGPNLLLLFQALSESEIPFSKQAAHLGSKISSGLNGPFKVGISL